MTQLQIGLKYWALSFVVCVIVLAGLEAVFRSELIWRLPQGVALAATNDMEIRSTWWSYQPPAAADRHVVLLGASTACASMELPGGETATRLSARAGGRVVAFRPLCAGRASFADYLVYLENAVEHGLEPDLVIAYTWPGMFTADSIDKALAHAATVPLVSDRWLDALEARGQFESGPLTTGWWLRRTAIARHRYYVNSWVRQRVARLFEGRFDWRLTFDENRYRRARARPLETDSDRYGRTEALPHEFLPGAAGDSGLVTLLSALRDYQIPTLLLEAPRSPPVRRLLQPIASDYRRLVGELAAEHGVTYLDPNDAVELGPELFADLYHVSWDGRERWLAHVLPLVAERLP